METFNEVLYVFTQSDEFTIIINKCNNEIDKIKLLTESSSKISSKFIKEVIKISSLDKIDLLPNIAFDARIGMYNTLHEAFELILWRAYDCSINGISQAVYFCGNPGSKLVSLKNSNEKLKYLFENKLLPLSDHQAYGTLFKKNHNGYNKIEGPVINNIKNNMFPEVFEM